MRKTMKRQRSQKGVYLVMFAFFVITLMAFAMLTIDTMVISHAKARLYTAADAAALAGVTHLVGPYDAENGTAAREDAKRLGAANGLDLEDQHVRVGRFGIPLASVAGVGTYTWGGQSYPRCFKYQFESGTSYETDMKSSASQVPEGRFVRMRDCATANNNGMFLLVRNAADSLYYIVQHPEDRVGASESSSPGEAAVFVQTVIEPDSIQVVGPRDEEGDEGSRQTVKLLIGPMFGKYEVSMTVPVVATQPRRAVMFVMDKSGSMNDNTELDPDRSGYRVISNKGVTSNQGDDNDWIYYSQRNGTSSSPVVPINPFVFATDKWMRVRYENSGGYRRATNSSASTYNRAQIFYNNPNRSTTSPNFSFSLSSTTTEWSRKTTAGSYWTSGVNYYPSGTQINYTTSYPSRGYYHTISYCDYQLPLYDSQVAAVSFIDRLEETRDMAGLATFAASETLEEDLDLLVNNKEDLQNTFLNYSASGNTSTEDGVELGYSKLQGMPSSVQKVMILLSDGLANRRHDVNSENYDSTPPSSYPTRTIDGVSGKYPFGQVIIDGLINDAYLCRDKSIRIYTVAFHFFRGDPPFDAGDHYLMPRMAEITRGTHHDVYDSSTLTDVFQEIFSQLPPLLND
ncbi:MAG TPA: vWA domain-containing protein [Candidatus Brocadiia bacterium]|nr:vWA domain-containing protein [Candidatus Brocadiia bacterium]